MRQQALEKTLRTLVNTIKEGGDVKDVCVKAEILLDRRDGTEASVIREMVNQ